MFDRYLPAKPATLADVASVQTPSYQYSPTGKVFCPISHSAFVRAIRESLENHKCTVYSEAYHLTSKGERLFGTFGLDCPDVDVRMILGFRNSHDKSCAAGVALGRSVLVCDNLMFSGEIVELRKHTRNIWRDLPGQIDNAIFQALRQREDMARTVQLRQKRPIGNLVAHNLICQAIRTGAISASQSGKVLQEWHNPSHEAFQPRTLWSLENAFTEAWKVPEGSPRGSLHRLERQSTALNRLIQTVPMP